MKENFLEAIGFLKEKSGLMKNSQMKALRDNLLYATGASVVYDFTMQYWRVTLGEELAQHA